MFRHAAAVALVVCLSPSWVWAQSPVFTVTPSPADVHKSPSTGAPVIGRAASGMVLPVTRELGSWVRVSWPAAEDGVGYVHVSWGRISNGTASTANRTAAPAPSIAPISAPGRPAEASSLNSSPSSPSSLSSPSGPTAHLVGIGGRMGLGSPLGFGASARAAVTGRFGIQLDLSRYSPVSAVAQERLTSLQVAPSVLYSLPDALSDYVWIKPYVGAGLTIYRSTLIGGTPGVASVTDSGLGRQLFAGTAVAFAGVPRFTLSMDYGYRWSQGTSSPLAGVELGGKGLSVSGHWYVR